MPNLNYYIYKYISSEIFEVRNIMRLQGENKWINNVSDKIVIFVKIPRSYGEIRDYGKLFYFQYIFIV